MQDSEKVREAKLRERKRKEKSNIIETNRFYDLSTRLKVTGIRHKHNKLGYSTKDKFFILASGLPVDEIGIKANKKCNHDFGKKKKEKPQTRKFHQSQPRIEVSALGEKSFTLDQTLPQLNTS